MAEIDRYESNPKVYWAAEPLERFAGALENRIRAYYDHLGGGQMELWRELYRAYYGRDPNGTDRTSHRITSGGEEGETPELRQNEFRSVLRHILTLATGTKPAVIAKSLTPDYRSLAARKVAEAIIDQALSNGHLEDRLVEVCELAIVLGEGGLYQWWDPDAGRETVGQDGQPVVQVVSGGPEEDAFSGAYREAKPLRTRIMHEGDIRALSLLPDDVVRDPKAHHWPEDAKWVAVRRPVNRWDLVARYPEHEDVILRAGKKADWPETLRDRDDNDCSDDDVIVFEFYHVRSNALPEGRASVYLDGYIIADGPMPYKRLPVHMMVPSKEKGRPFGYAKGADILGPSQALDAAAVTALANHDALGHQKIWIQPGSGAEVRDLGGGVTAIESVTQPIPLKLMETNEPSERQAEYWLGVIQRLSGINGVARGEPQASLKSGTALLFVHSQALQANSDIDKSFVRLNSETFSAHIEILRKFCKEARLVEMTGGNKTSMVRSFTAEDLGAVESIGIDFGNPALRGIPGRIETGKELLQLQAINPQQYLDLVATGRYEPLTMQPEMLRANISSENELMRKPEIDKTTGRMRLPKVLKTDPHPDHIAEHLLMLEDPHARYDDDFVQRVGQHVNDHQYWWYYVSRFEPALAMARKLPPPPPLMAPIAPPADQPDLPPMQPDVIAAAPGGPPGAPGGPPPGAPGDAPPPSGGSPQQPMSPVMPGLAGSPTGGPGAEQMPSMPTMPG